MRKQNRMTQNPVRKREACANTALRHMLLTAVNCEYQGRTDRSVATLWKSIGACTAAPVQLSEAVDELGLLPQWHEERDCHVWPQHQRVPFVATA